MVKDQRQKRFVDPAVQGALSRRLIWHWLLFLATGSSCALLVQVLSDPFQPFSHHLQNLWWSQGPILLVGVCLIPIFVNDTIRLSHRFVGPLVRIRGTMRKSGAGEIAAPVKLRPNDFWHEFADDFNLMLDRMNRLQATPSTHEERELVAH